MTLLGGVTSATCFLLVSASCVQVLWPGQRQEEAKRGIGGWLAEGHSGPGRGWRTGQSRAAGAGAEVSHKGKVPEEAASQAATRRGKVNSVPGPSPQERANPQTVPF